MPISKRLKRSEVIVERATDGSDNYEVVPKGHLGLIISGAGAKGISYAGVIKALDDCGKIRSLTHVCGASAGAMASSFLAVGISAENIKKLLSDINTANLFDRDVLSIRAKGEVLKNLLDVVYMVQIKQFLEGLRKPIPAELEKNYYVLNVKVSLYQDALAKQGLNIKNFDDIIKITNSVQDLKKLNAAFLTIPETIKDAKGRELESPHFTMGNLGSLRMLLAEKDKHLIKNLSVGVTDIDKHKVLHYGEDMSPEAHIASIVQLSSAHPLLFVPGKIENGDHVADGAILDNMPEIAGLDSEEVLCVAALDKCSYNDRLTMAAEDVPQMMTRFQRIEDDLFNYAIGGKWLNANTAEHNREQDYYHIDNMIYVNSGTITTVTISPTKDQKDKAIHDAYEQTMECIRKQKKTFDNPLLASMYANLNLLEDKINHANQDDPLFYNSAVAQMITYLQQQMIVEMNNNDYSSIRYYLERINDILMIDGKISGENLEKAAALCYQQVDFVSDGKLVKFLNEVAPKNQSWVSKFTEYLERPFNWFISLIKDSRMPTPVPGDEVVVEPGDIPTKSGLRGNNTTSSKPSFFSSASDEIVGGVEDELDRKPGSSGVTK